MKTLARIQQQLAAGGFDFSRHTFMRAVERNISEQEIRTAGARAEIIEEYREDKYSPSNAFQLMFPSCQRKPGPGTGPAWRPEDGKLASTSRVKSLDSSLRWNDELAIA
ncbi:MAG: DUF4258 domain-containing protein [Pseudomonadota bacterium]|nr:DUF4258 domain-containing protein [Pseudomonadota bacterium]